jgi:hypothetical protein
LKYLTNFHPSLKDSRERVWSCAVIAAVMVKNSNAVIRMIRIMVFMS